MTQAPPKIAIVGYGRMGHEVKATAEARGLAVSRVIRNRAELETAKFEANEVAICFTNPSQEAHNIRHLAYHKVSMVVGTTGWHEDIPDLQDVVTRSQIGLLHATNFSLGVQLMMRLVRQAAALFSGMEAYDVLVHEWHHRHKQDAPSGTAKSLAQAVLENFPRKKNWIYPPHDRALQPDEIGVSAARGGSAFGQHDVIFDSEGDTITLSHTSKGRAAYAQGAVTAAQWLHGRKGLFTIDDMLKEVLS